MPVAGLVTSHIGRLHTHTTQQSPWHAPEDPRTHDETLRSPPVPHRPGLRATFVTGRISLLACSTCIAPLKDNAHADEQDIKICTTCSIYHRRTHINQKGRIPLSHTPDEGDNTPLGIHIGDPTYNQENLYNGRQFNNSTRPLYTCKVDIHIVRS